jgi:hypothetical protein
MNKTETAKEFIKRKEEQFLKELERNNKYPDRSKKIKMKDIGRKGKHQFIRESWCFMVQHNLSEKVFVIERLRKHSTEGEIIHKKEQKAGEIEYRIGYYIVGKIRKAKGRWIWGQFCPLIPSQDFKKLLNKAEQEGVIL